MRTLFLRPGTHAEAPSLGLSGPGRTAVRGTTYRARRELSPFELAAVVCANDPPSIQAAELAAGVLDFLGPVVVLAEIGPTTPPEVLLGKVLPLGETVLVVADEPALSRIAATLAGRPSFPTLTPGELAVLDERRPSCTFREGASMAPLLLA